jgi:hypothetical protein
MRRCATGFHRARTAAAPANATVSRAGTFRMNHDSPETTPAPQREPSSDPRCKRVLALLTGTPAWDASLCARLEEAFGPIDYRGPFHPFAEDGYYAAEMGSPLWRGWLSFRGLADPSGLPAWKQAARALEARGSRDGRRAHNLDVGYMDADKLVLASCKRGPHKLYLDRGVWADMILGYSRGAFVPLPRTFPDFRDGRYDKSLGIIRDKLKAEMRR